MTVLLGMLLIVGDVVEVIEEELELELVTVSESAIDVVLEDRLDVWMLDTVVGLVTETVTKAYE